MFICFFVTSFITIWHSLIYDVLWLLFLYSISAFLLSQTIKRENSNFCSITHKHLISSLESFPSISVISYFVLYRFCTSIRGVIRTLKTSMTHVCVSGGKKCSFFGKFGVLCFLVTPILRFAGLPYCRRIIIWPSVKYYYPSDIGRNWTYVTRSEDMQDVFFNI